MGRNNSPSPVRKRSAVTRWAPRSKWQAAALVVGVFLVVITVGALVLSHLEGWNTVDSIYATTMMCSTVGYGDFVPITDGGKLFASFYSLLGVMTFFSVTALGARYIVLSDSTVQKHGQG